MVGIEATGSMQWFLKLMEELGIECRVGHPKEVRKAETRKQKHDRRDARLLLKLLVENRFPTIWMPSSEQRDLRTFVTAPPPMGAHGRVQHTLQSMALMNGLRRGHALRRSKSVEHLKPRKGTLCAPALRTNHILILFSCSQSEIQFLRFETMACGSYSLRSGRARTNSQAYWTADSLKQLEQTLQTEGVANARYMSVRPLADFGNDTFMLSRREADGIVEWHENQADVFFVQSGSATLVFGGTVVGGELVELHEKRNGTIHGGIRRKLSAGDIVRIPPQVPHQILLDGSKEFTYFVIKVKGY